MYWVGCNMRYENKYYKRARSNCFRSNCRPTVVEYAVCFSRRVQECILMGNGAVLPEHGEEPLFPIVDKRKKAIQNDACATRSWTFSARAVTSSCLHKLTRYGTENESEIPCAFFFFAIQSFIIRFNLFGPWDWLSLLRFFVVFLRFFTKVLS